MPRSRFAACLFAAAVLGCLAVNRTIVEEKRGGPRIAGEPVAMGRCFEQHGGSRKRAFLVVRTRPEWDALWSAPHGQPAPQLDFSEQMVLAAFAGRKPTAGYSIRVERVARAGAEQIVEVVESSPAPGCQLAEAPTYPFHLVAVPRWEGTVRFVVETRARAGCLAPPEIRLACRAASPEPWRSAGPVLHPSPGERIECEGRGEGVVAWTWSLLGRPEGSAAKLEPDGPRAALATDRPGAYLLGVQARSADGQASLQRVEVEAGTPAYQVFLRAEEPDGALGLRLAIERGESRCVFGAGDAPPWCAGSGDEYASRFEVPAGEGDYRLLVLRTPESQPSATVVVRLGDWEIARVEVPSDEARWPVSGAWQAGTLDSNGARLSR
ncbi:MAG: protease complex subunit PrcB family protein [Myxococcales bacterium]